MTQSKTKLSADFWVGFLAPVIAVGMFLAVLPLLLLRAWVLMKLWGWYLVPIFGVEPLQMVYAFGVLLIVGYVTARHRKTESGFWELMAWGLTHKLLTLGLGWAGTWFA